MIDIDSRLDARLQSFYEHIEEQQPSRGFETFEASRHNPRRRALNLVAGVAGVAVVAAGIGIFGTELARHHNVKPPASAVRPTLPSEAQLTLGLPSISHTVIEVTRGHGSASLPTFTPQGILMFLFACNGNGPISVNLLGHPEGMFGKCDVGSIQGDSVPADAAIDGKPLTLEISAEPSVEWEIVVADTGPVAPLPILGASTVPAGALILVPATSGTGTAGLLTFVPTRTFFVQYACTGAGTIGFSLNGAHFATAACANGAIGIQAVPTSTRNGVTNLTVEAAPHQYWEVQVYELPGAKA
jgi:hypothetical protein